MCYVVFILPPLMCCGPPLCSSGGIELYNARGNIKVANTLDSRLDLMAQQVCSL